MHGQVMKGYSHRYNLQQVCCGEYLDKPFLEYNHVCQFQQLGINSYLTYQKRCLLLILCQQRIMQILFLLLIHQGHKVHNGERYRVSFR